MPGAGGDEKYRRVRLCSSMHTPAYSTALAVAGGRIRLAAAALPELGAREVAGGAGGRGAAVVASLEAFSGRARVVVAVPFGAGVHEVFFAVGAVHLHNLLGWAG